jgi:hypothetical protein
MSDIEASVVEAIREEVSKNGLLSGPPALFCYRIEAITSGEEDEDEPVTRSPEEKGSLILLLKTAIDTLDEARESHRPE